MFHWSVRNNRNVNYKLNNISSDTAYQVTIMTNGLVPEPSTVEPGGCLHFRYYGDPLKKKNITVTWVDEDGDNHRWDSYIC